MEHAAGGEHHPVGKHGEAGVEVQQVRVVRQADDHVEMVGDELEREADRGGLGRAHAKPDQQDARAVVHRRKHVAALDIFVVDEVECAA